MQSLRLRKGKWEFCSTEGITTAVRMGNGVGIKMVMRKRITNMWEKLKMGNQMVKEHELM